MSRYDGHKNPLSYRMSAYTNQKIDIKQQQNSKGIPCHVTKVDKDFVYVAFETHDSILTPPVVKLPQSFSQYAREPTQVGDKGYAVPSNYYLGGVSGLGGGSTNYYPRGNLTALSFQPISRTDTPTRDYDQHTISGGPNGVKIIQTVPKQTTTQPSIQPTQPNPAARRRFPGTFANAPSPPAAPPAQPAAQPKPLANMQIDKNGVITHSSADGQHVISIDQNAGKVAVKVPPGHIVYLGGDGTQGTYAPVMTPLGASPNVWARIG